MSLEYALYGAEPQGAVKVRFISLETRVFPTEVTLDEGAGELTAAKAATYPDGTPRLPFLQSVTGSGSVIVPMDVAQYAMWLGAYVHADTYVAVAGKPTIPEAAASPVAPLWMDPRFAERIQAWLDDTFGAGTSITVNKNPDGTFTWSARAADGSVNAGTEDTRQAALSAARAWLDSL